MQRNFDAVIWDFGGVITSSPFEAFARYEAANGVPKDFIRSNWRLSFSYKPNE